MGNIQTREELATVPKPSWTMQDAETVPDKWDMGRVSAGQSSEQATFLFWNNKGGTEVVSDMQDTLVTTTDNAGDTLDVVSDKWVEVRCNSADEESFTQIGGTETHSIKARGQEAGIIKGSINDGLITDTDNFTSLTFVTTPPLNVQPGKRPFKIRVIYYFT